MSIARGAVYIADDEEQRELDGHGGVIRGLEPSIAVPPHFCSFCILSWAVAITQAQGVCCMRGLEAVTEVNGRPTTFATVSESGGERGSSDGLHLSG
jgi:hypothetical protein